MQNKTLAYCSLSRFFVGRNSAITKTSCRINHHKNRNKITYNKNKDKNKNINNKIKNKTQQSSLYYQLQKQQQGQRGNSTSNNTFANRYCHNNYNRVTPTKTLCILRCLWLLPPCQMKGRHKDQETKNKLKRWDFAQAQRRLIDQKSTLTEPQGDTTKVCRCYCHCGNCHLNSNHSSRTLNNKLPPSANIAIQQWLQGRTALSLPSVTPTTATINSNMTARGMTIYDDDMINQQRQPRQLQYILNFMICGENECRSQKSTTIPCTLNNKFPPPTKIVIQQWLQARYKDSPAKRQICTCQHNFWYVPACEICLFVKIHLFV